MDWTVDPWFAKHWASKVTPEFEAAWLDYYGTLADISDTAEEKAEYWIRCSLYLAGWLAAIQSLTSKEPT